MKEWFTSEGFSLIVNDKVVFKINQGTQALIILGIILLIIL